MKVMLVCAGGYSTGILMKKMEKYAKEQGLDFLVDAYGMGEYESVFQDYDVILVGPQISYKKDEIKERTGKPLAVVQQMDYALGNAENIMKQVNELMAQL